MRDVESKYKSLPFWSWNDKLKKDELVKQVEWMNENGVGGFFMHARGGLKTEYLGKEWFECIDACCERAKELGMEAYAYDENGWPSGFAGGKLLEDIENHDKYLTYEIGSFDSSALVSYEFDTDRLKRVDFSTKECLNIYEHYSTSTADILNPQVVDRFIELTHEEYRKRDSYSLKGFFTDEPQYHRWGTPYTKVLPEYFKETYGEDILDGLGLLYLEKEGYRTFRYRFWKSMQALMLENFAKKIYDWCDKYGYKLTGHYIEEDCLCGQMLCCGGIMPFYEYEHIPGIDHLGGWIPNEMPAKQVSSVAAQLGKRQVITETFACCGWNITPMKLKSLAEAQYVSGVNLMAQHLLPYKEHGQRKRDYPAHYSSINPWVKKNFAEFNAYFSVLGKALSESDEIVNVGMLHPIRSAYFDYKRFPEKDYNGLKDLELSLKSLVDTLCYMGIPHHYIDETILEKHGHVDGNSIIVGNYKYDYLIIPKIYTMDKSTEKLLSIYVKNGGKVLLYDEKPEYLEGERYDYSYLSSNTSLEEIAAVQPFSISKNNNVRTSYRRDTLGNEFIYAVNLGDEITVDFELKNGTSFKSYDILKDEYSIISTQVHFDKGQSYILYISREIPSDVSELTPIYLNKEFKIKEKVDNYLTLDYIRYSTDGVNYSEPLHHMGVFDELLKMRYCGKLYIKYDFKVNSVPKKCKLLLEYESPIEIYINGYEPKKLDSCDLEEDFYEYDIAKHISSGNNEITVVLDYSQGEDVYYALFGENVTESLKNCLAYDTEIEPVYLKGDFGVFGSFTKGKNENVLLGTDFYIDEQPSVVSSLIENGFPFFSGDIVLEQEIYADGVNKELVLEDKFLLADVKINDTFAGRMMFSCRLDLSKYLQVGRNKLELTLTVSNRNLFGPFHTREEESPWVSPDSFERFGTWVNGKSSIMNDSYALVKNII